MKNFLTALALLLTYSILGANYDVSPSGNDSNSGNEVSPFKTLTRAISKASLGDMIYLKGGNYDYTNSIVTTRIEDTDSGTISYDGSLKSYSAADNGQAINLSNSSGKEIVWNYDTSSSGDYQLTIRYTRKASMNSSVDISVNGSTQTLSLPVTSSSQFATVSLSVNLNNGSNAIILRTNSSGESADIDWIEITGENGGDPTPDPDPDPDPDPQPNTTVTLQENETGFCAVNGSVDNNHSGYTGAGFSNTNNQNGTGIDWSIAGDAGSYTFVVGYANGSSTNRTGVLSINGASVATLDFNGTGGWATWNTTSVTIDNVVAGTKTIRLEANQGSGLGNIDYLEVTGAGVSAESCGGSTDPDPDPDPVTYTLSTSTSPSNGGSISLSPSGGTYDEGTVVTVTATSASGYTFASWSGDATGSSTTTTVTMNSNKNVTAQFNNTDVIDDANYDIVGYATENGGTTGGQNGTSVTCSTGDCILDAIKQKKDGDISQPLIIYVNGTITESNTSATKIDVKEVRDVSIIGVGTSGLFDGIGIKIYKAGNIIIQNVTVRRVRIGDKDAISIEGPADHIWIDHCELYAEYQSVGKDYYDGLLDAKRDAEYITYSYNYLHDSWKMMLVGSSESDDYDRKITIHHNYFDNVNSRMPLYRGGQGHIFNNYYSGVVSTAVNSRIGACLKVENNYFQDSNNVIVSAYSDVLGEVDESGNIFDNVTWDFSNSDVSDPASCSLNVPYSYNSSLNATADVPSIVVANAGVGKLSSTNSSKTINNNNTELLVYPNPVKGHNMLNIELPEFNGTESIRIVNILGVEVLHQKANAKTMSVDVSPFKTGTYIIQLKTGGHTSLKMFIKQ